MTRRIDALTIGEAMIALSAEDGDIATADRLRISVGGAEANVAVTLTRLGHRVEWAGHVGDDVLGDRVVATIAAAGVGTTCVRATAGATGLYIKGAAGPLYYRSDSAASRMTAEDAVRWAGLLQPRLVHVSGVLAVLSPACTELVRRVIVGRCFGDALVSFDVNARPALADSQTPSLLRELAGAADVVFVGRDEAAGLWGTSDCASVRSLLPGVPTLVVKDAAVEAVSFSPAGVVAVPARQVEVVEPTGAGDAFAAGWLGAWLSGADDGQRLAAGHSAARAALASVDDVPSGLAGAPA